MSEQSHVNGFSRYRLDAIVRQFMDFRGRTPLKLGMDWGGGDIRALSANNVQMGYIDFDKDAHVGSEALYHKWMNRGDCEKGDVLFTTEAPLGNVAQIPDDKKYILSQRTILLKNDRTKSHADYLCQLFQSKPFQSELIRHSTGTTVVGIQQARLATIEVNLPPLPAQRKIASILTTVDRLIEQTEALIEKYRRVKQGMMADLLSRGVDSGGKLRPTQQQAPQLYKESELGWIPKEWEVETLGSLAWVSSGVTLGRKLDPQQAIHLPYLRVANVQDGYLDLTEMKTVPVLRGEVERHLLRQGDVVMTEGGDFDKLGRGTIWEGQIAPCLHQNHVFKVRSNGPRLNSEFLAALTGAEYGRHYFLMCSKQTTNLASINTTQVRAFPVLLPTEEEQSAICNRTRSIDDKIQRETVSVAKLRTLKTGLMQDLLTGKVRVQVDQDEETTQPTPSATEGVRA